MVPLATLLVREMNLDIAALPAWMPKSSSVELVVRLRAFHHAKPAVEARPLVKFKHAKHVISIRRYYSRVAIPLFPEECHESALKNVFHPYNLTRASMTVANFDIHVSQCTAIYDYTGHRRYISMPARNERIGSSKERGQGNHTTARVRWTLYGCLGYAKTPRLSLIHLYLFNH